MPFAVCKVPMEHVQDTAGIEAAMREWNFGADDIVDVVAKTEGNGSVNDISRILVDRVLRDFLTQKGARPRQQALQVPIALSGGCDGVISPHINVFARVAEDDISRATKDELRLTVGFAVSAKILPEEIGRPPMVEKVAAGVRKAMKEAGISDPKDVHFVQTKTPLLTAERIADAKRRGKDVIKCEPDPGGRLRGRRQVSLNDSDIHRTHHTKAVVGAVAAAASGDPMVYGPVAALQQGPEGGGPVAAIIDVPKIKRA